MIETGNAKVEIEPLGCQSLVLKICEFEGSIAKRVAIAVQRCRDIAL